MTLADNHRVAVAESVVVVVVGVASVGAYAVVEFVVVHQFVGLVRVVDKNLKQSKN